MYYARELFVKRGPLATMWLAGHVMRRVHKQQVVQANIEQMCSVVSQPPVALALPTQSTLLRGVVRIENKKTSYLLEDAESAATKLTEPRKKREDQTAPRNKIQAKRDTITFTDAEQTHLLETQIPGLEELDDMALLVEQTGEMDIDLEEGESRLHLAEEAAFTARSEDITLSQDLGGIGAGFDEMEFGGMDADMAMADGFGFEEQMAFEELPPGAVSPAISELAPPPPPALDLETVEMPVRARKRRRRAFVPTLDEQTELTGPQFREQLADPSDTMRSRPDMPPPYAMDAGLDAALPAPSSLDSATTSIPVPIRSLFQHLCAIRPVLDEAGHHPADIEMEMGGDAGWDLESGFMAEEERAEEYESIITGGDMDDMSRSMAREEGLEGEAVLFGEPSEAEVSGLEARRGRPSRRFELVSDMETPVLGVPESQFEIPIEEIRAKMPRATIERRAVNKHTEIFRNEVEKKFAQLAREGAPPEVELDSLLQGIVHGDPVRRDRALAFYQVLVLSSLDILRVDQPVPFGDITLLKGPKFAVRFSSSQMFTPSQSQ